MFIETYYDERATVPGSTNEPMIPYPESYGEELEVWRKYLPIRRPIRNLDSRLNREIIPGPVITEIEKARKPHLFDRVEIWSRADDPMAVGIIREKTTRYFSIARWGDRETGKNASCVWLPAKDKFGERLPDGSWKSGGC